MTYGVVGRWTLGPARAAVLAAMPDVATIYRATTTRTAGGYAQSDPWPVAGTTRCRLTTSLTTVPSEQPGASQLVSITHWMLTVPAGADIRRSDRIEVQGTLFEVLGGFQSSTLNVSDTYSLAEIQA